jgi:hypothetical protein
MGTLMPRYDVHLRSKAPLMRDREGVDLPDPMTAHGAADKVASELHGGLLHETKECCCWTVSATDEGDPLVHVTAL